jgi:uncharacterized membrane protein
MVYRWQHVTRSGTQEWLLKRNCALSPAQSAVCFACICLLSLGIATGFGLLGAWMVMPFALLEAVGLVAAFFWFGRHAADYEKIQAAQGRVTLETGLGSTVSRLETVAPWFRVEYDGRSRELIKIGSGNKQFQVGRFVPSNKRGQLAKEIRQALNGAA